MRAVDLCTDLTPDSTGVSLQDGEQGKALLLMDLGPLMIIDVIFSTYMSLSRIGHYSKGLSICLGATAFSFRF